ncbi:MAG: phytoene desaturase [Deltaproteobacteria bacterium]|nr:phytoene desaturase [Deltaproteobacteria bacterium]
MSDSSDRTVAVIGAGLGGIGAAASLAAAGRCVHVFEKNEHVGGKLNIFQREGFSFDLGPSILTMPQVFEKLFAKGGRKFSDYVSIRHLSPHWRNFFEDGSHIDLYATPAETVENNTLLDEKDRCDLENFLAYSRNLYEKCRHSYFDLGLDTVREMVRHHGIWNSLTGFDLFSSMDAGVGRHVHHPKLRAILDFFVKYVGSSAFDAPAVLNLLPFVQSEFGLLYVDGGLFELARGLHRMMEDLGVHIHLGVEVTDILHEGLQVRGLRLNDGSEFPADMVVSNMEVIPAHRGLLGESENQLRRFKRFEPACSGLVLHLGIDREYRHLAHHNFFFSQNPRAHFNTVFREKRLPEDPTIYLVAPARSDASQAPQGCENLKILPHIPYVQEPPFTRKDYWNLKERVLDKLERMGLENLRSHIIVEHMWVPEDIERLYFSNRGAIYGVVSHRWKNQGFKAPKKSDRFDNLYFVGGSVNPGGGMPMALLSGLQVADRIIQTENC